jgi:hypothetical protein
MKHGLRLTCALRRWCSALTLASAALSLVLTGCGQEDDGTADDGDTGGSGEGDSPPVEIPPSAGAWRSDYAEAQIDVDSSGNDCTTTAEALEGSDLARVVVEEAALYVGYDQVSSDNQDPVVALVRDGAVAWCRHHEDDGPDCRALGVTWDGGDFAYVVYTIVGGGTDLEKPGWFGSYGGHAGISGGGSKVSVVGRVETESGELEVATHIIAIKSDGKVNSHVPAGAVRVLSDGSVEFYGESAHKALGADGRGPMGCTDYPFDSRYRFTSDLSAALCAECSNCTENTLACPGD